MDMSSSAKYPTNMNERALVKTLIEVIESVEVKSFVSLGPGNGQMDDELAVQLARRAPRTRLPTGRHQ